LKQPAISSYTSGSYCCYCCNLALMLHQLPATDVAGETQTAAAANAADATSH